MKKTSTVQAFKSELFKEQKLTIGLDLGDRWSFYCVMDEAGQVIDEADLWKDTAKPHGTGDRNAFSLGQPAAQWVGTGSDRGACTKGAADHQEQSKR